MPLEPGAALVILLYVLTLYVIGVVAPRLTPSLVALVDASLGQLCLLVQRAWADFPVLTLQGILGWILRPLAWAMGVPWDEAAKVGSLLGVKTVLNEFVAYVELNKMIAAGELSERARTIATYALCGFANFSSIAIQIGGIGGLAPNRRADLARFGLRAVLGGSLATFMTATIAGVLEQL